MTRPSPRSAPRGQVPRRHLRVGAQADQDRVGKYLQLTFQIIDGEFKGRLVWARLNLENKSEMTVKIARGELSAICRAIGVMQPKDSVELHNVPLEINVGLKKRDDNGEFTNVIKGYAKKGGGGSPVSGRAPVGVGPGSTPPWKR